MATDRGTAASRAARASAAPGSPRLPDRYLTIAAFILVFLFFFLLQFSTEALVDRDGYFHIKFSQLMRENGLIHSLPWLQYTIHKDHYRDHHFLQHVLYLPFTFGDLLFWGKFASALFASLAGVCFYALLRGCKIRFALFWVVVYLAASPAFLYRISMLRVQSISLAMMLAAVGLIIHKRYKSLFALAFAFVWLYDAFPLLLVIVLIFFLCELGAEKKADYRLLAYVGAGLLAGMVINPFFPSNIGSYLFNLARISSTDPNSWVGNEWRPYSTLVFLQEAWVCLIVFFGAIGMLLGRMERRSHVLYALFGISLFFLALLMKSRRFIEYWPPFAVLFSAFAVHGVLARRSRDEGVSGAWLRSRFPAVFAGAAICCCALLSYHAARDEMKNTINNDQYKGAAIWLKEHTAPGTIVFNTDWDDFSQLFFYNDQNYYIVGLDPNYMRKYDESLYRDWQEITRGRVHAPSRAIVDRFRAFYVVTDNSHHAFLRRADEDRHMTAVYRDAYCSVYSISEDREKDG